MKKIIGLFLLGAAVVVVNGCATIIKGKDQQVFLDTPGHTGAQCVIANDKNPETTVTTPATFELRKSRQDVAVSCSKGCFRGQGIIPTKIEAATAGNLIAGGVIGLGVDAATGAIHRYKKQNQITLFQVQNCGVNPAPGFNQSGFGPSA